MHILLGAAICAIAAAIVMSPVTVAAAVVLAFITIAASRGVSGIERRTLLWMLAIAIALRVAVIAALFLWADPYQVSVFPFDGDGRHLKLRSLWIRNIWLDIPVDPSQFSAAYDAYGWTSYALVLAYVQYLLGPAPYAIHLLSVCWAIGAAGLLYRLIRRSFGPVPAVVALTLMLFVPTLFLWSVSAIKDAWHLLLMTLVFVGMERAVRGGHWAVRAAWASAVVAAAFALGTTRAGALFVVVVVLLIALTGTFLSRRPLALAASIVALPLLVMVGLQQPAVQARILEHVQTAATRHIGHVKTEGYAYKLLDQRFYSGDSPESMNWHEASRFMFRAVSSFVLVPLPWQSASRRQLLFIPQQLLWYALVLLAGVGAVQAARRDLFVTWLFIGFIGGSAVVIAPHEGNIGTLVRHRDAILPFVICLSAVALAALFAHVNGAARSAIDSSAVLRPVRPLGPWLRTAWRQSACARVLDDIRAAEGSLRCIGLGLLAGTALTVVLRPFVRLAWPSLLMWGATAAVALVMILYDARVLRWRKTGRLFVGGYIVAGGILERRAAEK